MDAPDSIFTRIIKGEVPGYKVYEDDNTIAILDIHPVQPGHTLVIPKKQIESVWDLEDQDYLDLLKVAKLVALHLKKALNEPYVSLGVVGTDVPHAHLHLIPFKNSTDLRRLPDLDATPDHASLAAMLKKLTI